MKGWVFQQKTYFLTLLRKEMLSRNTIAALDQAYKFSRTKNINLMHQWLRLCLHNKFVNALPLAVDYVQKQGNTVLLREIYTAMAKVDRDLAVLTFKQRKWWYHPTAAKQVSKALHLV
jgi:hypothetical protein